MSAEPARRAVRATPAFFADLDRQLPSRPGPGGVPPSRGDFQAYDLLPVVERFAVGFDELPQPIPGRADYRILITTGRLVLAMAVTGQLAPDGAVELVQLDIDSGRLDERAEDLDSET